jgi:hypothetical protein
MEPGSWQDSLNAVRSRSEWAAHTTWRVKRFPSKLAHSLQMQHGGGTMHLVLQFAGGIVSVPLHSLQLHPGIRRCPFSPYQLGLEDCDGSLGILHPLQQHSAGNVAGTTTRTPAAGIISSTNVQCIAMGSQGSHHLKGFDMLRGMGAGCRLT